jgi:hypothetical protein
MLYSVSGLSKTITLEMNAFTSGMCVSNLGSRPPRYSGSCSPDPPNSGGKSFSLGKPSRIGRTVSA